MGLARVANFPQPEFQLARARHFHQAQLEQPRIARQAGLCIDAEPGRMHVHLAGRLVDVKAPRSRQICEPQPLFFPVEGLFPLREIQSLAGCKPGLRMKPRLFASGCLKRQALHD